MAEVLAVVSVVASIVQLVDFSSKVLHRLEEFQSNAAEVPKSFRHLKAELAVLGDTLRQIKEANDAGSVEVRTERALLPVIEGCCEQVAQLDTVLAKTLPEANESWRKRSKKAIVSLHQDSKVESIARILRNYIRTLTFYYAAGSSTLRPLTGRHAVTS
jgi:vacuolar-type H+-ATPase subunit I/STV1